MKKLFALLLITLGFIAYANSEEQNLGYVYDIYGNVVHVADNTCLHTAYYDSSNKLGECVEDVSSSTVMSSTP